MRKSRRLDTIPPYLFAEIDKKKAAALARGVDVINLGVGDPDTPTPSEIVQAAHVAIDDPSTHNYPPYEGTAEFRKAVATYYQRRFGVDLNPDNEVMALIGSKEGIAHIALAFLDAGDIALVPDPGYPVYGVGTRLAGAEPYAMPLTIERDFLPDFSTIPTDIAKRAKIMHLNYPNNPTGAVATAKFFAEAISFAIQYDIVIAHDLAYSEIGPHGYRSPSFLQVPGAKDVGIEFNSLSKTFNMTGWRIGMAVGNAEVIAALGVIKTNVDSGAFKAIQKAAITGLLGDQGHLGPLNDLYDRRRQILLEGLKQLGWEKVSAASTFYVWVPIPEGTTSIAFAARML
ncbi:MAG: LL-diaminopimelate aminotransferase, partial [Candidatus Sericytochromatia bacterium]|nr:LL-diaminopimelate aminotransferase [Candidatus Sericytochromatia bacterium]